MEKRKRILPKILALLCVAVLVFAYFAVSVSASDVHYGDNDLGTLSPTIPLRSITYYDVYASSITSNDVDFLVDNPFIYFDYGIDMLREGKQGVVTNYPYQDGVYTNTGRTLYYAFELHSMGDDVIVDVRTPMTYADNTTTLVPTNARSTKYTFGNFVLVKGSSDVFGIQNTKSTVIRDYETQYRLTIKYREYYDEAKTAYIVRQKNYTVPIHAQTHDALDINYSFIASILGVDTDLICIEEMEILYVPFYADYDAQRPNNENKITNTNYHISLDTSRDIYARYSAWFVNNPIIEREFIGIGDISLTDWLTNAVGGFFDFEIMPNVSLGGILLVIVSVGLFMLFIRIFKG